MTNISPKEVHVIKYFSSFVSIAAGKVIHVTEPGLAFCPLAKHLYEAFDGIQEGDTEAIKKAIKTAIESKIRDYGFFTGKRKFTFDGVSIPYGASEMLSFALRKKEIDAAVVVCEGAGTVITDSPRMVQGIGARMNSVVLTFPIPGILEQLTKAGCTIVFENAHIGQVQGAREAIRAGYTRIAVTVDAQAAECLPRLRLLEKENNVTIITLVVCTTRATPDQIVLMREHADVVWACASSGIRRLLGPLARYQLSAQIPVFVMTRKGADCMSAYCDEPERIKSRDLTRQYFISSMAGTERLRMGNFDAFISERVLPVAARRPPIAAAA